tara:strand:- start:131 stop:514 length:384 start_codon:yes stop_codon:yes gene_type:complete
MPLKCPIARAAYMKQYLIDNPRKKRPEYMHKHYLKIKETNREARKAARDKYAKSPKGIKNNKVTGWRTAGIIDEDLNAVYDYYILETNCMICNKEYKNSKDRCLDHHHQEGYIRYICCNFCNVHVVG